MDKYDKLKEIKELFDKGLINQDEFSNLKKKILFDKELKKDSTSNQTYIFNAEQNNNSSISTDKKVNNRKKFYIFFIILFCATILALSMKNDFSKKKNFDSVDEFNKINFLIKNKQTDSTSNTFNDYDYKYWCKDGKVIKLSVFTTDNEDFSTNEDYYFNNNDVIAYKIKDVNLADNMNYTALIYFNDSNIIGEEYWIDNMNSGDSKDEIKTKMFETYLAQHSLSIQSISKDKKTNKSIGLLSLSELSNRYGFDNQIVILNSNNLNSNNNFTFEGQQLKSGEKIIKMNWSMENKIHLTRDHGVGHFVSPIMTVPTGKKWVMLYSMENYKFNNSGLELSMVPNLSVDNNIKEVYGMLHEDKNKINLSKAKDENVKYYSGSRIQAISNREKSGYDGENFDNYNGEIWFLEFNQ